MSFSYVESAKSSTEFLGVSPTECLGVHRGAIDQTTITTQPPPTVMKRVKEVLQSMGVEIQVESDYKYRCIRCKRPENEIQKPSSPQALLTPLEQVIYGEQSEDPADEVRFSVELTRLDRLNDTYSLDIRRLRGNLRSYKFVYDTLRERADLSR